MHGLHNVSPPAASNALWEAPRSGCSVQVLDPGNQRYAERTVSCVHTSLQSLHCRMMHNFTAGMKTAVQCCVWHTLQQQHSILQTKTCECSNFTAHGTVVPLTAADTAALMCIRHYARALCKNASMQHTVSSHVNTDGICQQ